MRAVLDAFPPGTGLELCASCTFAPDNCTLACGACRPPGGGAPAASTLDLVRCVPGYQEVAVGQDGRLSCQALCGLAGLRHALMCSVADDGLYRCRGCSYSRPSCTLACDTCTSPFQAGVEGPSSFNARGCLATEDAIGVDWDGQLTCNSPAEPLDT